MNLLENLIKKLIENELTEKAATISDVTASDLCLIVSKNSANTITCVLFDRFEFYNYYDTNQTDPRGIIFGMINITQKQPCGFYSVNTVAAQEGYGPLMYDIAMSVISPNYLASDRDSVSYAAKNIWNFMIANRKEDFDIVPIINKNCKFSVPNEENQALDFKYKIKEKLDVNILVSNAKESFIEIENDFKKGISVIKTDIIELGKQFFSKSPI